LTTIYLINNGLTMNNLMFDSREPLKNKREKRILSIEAEHESELLCNLPYLEKILFFKLLTVLPPAFFINSKILSYIHIMESISPTE